MWKSGDYEAHLVFTVTMKNHDVIRVRQTHHFHAAKTYTHTPEDASMYTAAEVQALLEEIARTAEKDAEVNVRLPAVTYDGALTLDRRAVNLYGSADAAGVRTTFTAPIRLAYSGGAISCFEGIDFTGNGGTGISAASRLHLTSCRLSGWETAALCEETAWVNADQCIFSDNDADIDNRCGQELELDQTIFQWRHAEVPRRGTRAWEPYHILLFCNRLSQPRPYHRAISSSSSLSAFRISSASRIMAPGRRRPRRKPRPEAPSAEPPCLVPYVLFPPPRAALSRAHPAVLLHSTTFRQGKPYAGSIGSGENLKPYAPRIW